ncbi:GNAT family N-acetyltransferase [Aliikangiella sp. G2MR2-5]|uniref:GNAT family N-acetyltransferase n=1 Tax=Aliikangiella sp. G2MR2-5 TaxID=2788943 RepID=UPI0018AB73E1|nr:GNAT family N-acetyltransferase [Aliikangiella sp. G2MR2-5]
MLEINLVTKQEAGAISLLAKPIWEEHYIPIIGSAQVEYMLEKFQSESAIQEQIEQGYQYYLVIQDEQPVGYFSVQPRSNTLFLSKFYLDQSTRGKGFGRQMLTFVESLARQSAANKIELTVNKFNPAYEAYLKMGFENIEAIQIDIGNGYIMDDYRMNKIISPE